MVNFQLTLWLSVWFTLAFVDFAVTLLFIDNTGRCYLGMARAIQCTRQMSGQLPSIISQLQSHTAKNRLHHLLLWSLLTQQL